MYLLNTKEALVSHFSVKTFFVKLFRISYDYLVALVVVTSHPVGLRPGSNLTLIVNTFKRWRVATAITCREALIKIDVLPLNTCHITLIEGDVLITIKTLHAFLAHKLVVQIFNFTRMIVTLCTNTVLKYQKSDFQNKPEGC